MFLNKLKKLNEKNLCLHFLRGFFGKINFYEHLRLFFGAYFDGFQSIKIWALVIN